MSSRLSTKQLRGTVKPNQIDLSTASAGADPSSRDYVNTQISASLLGRDFKESVRVASTANVSLTAPGTAIDGITLNNGDRVLLKNQTTASQNGIYIFNGSSSTMTRSSDADTSAKVTSQLTVAVEEGTANANITYKLNTPQAITLGTTALSFAIFSTNYYATPTKANKGMTAAVTVNDNDLACNTGLAATPAQGGYVGFVVNGQLATAGDGTKAGCEVYWSGDGGTTARALNALVAGDKPYWVGSFAGYQLDAGDTIDYDYAV